MRRAAFLAVALLLGLALAPMFSMTVECAEEPPQPMATWTIANESWFDDATWFNPADGDDLIINAGGIVHMMWNWSGSQPGTLVGFNGITVNIGAIFIQHNGTTCLIKTTFGINVNEGGQWRSLGTSGSRCTITLGGIGSANNLFRTVNGGKIYLDYTDVTGFYYCGNSGGGFFEAHNSTIVGRYPSLALTHSMSEFIYVNCTINQTLAGGYVLYGATEANIKAIDCAFLSTTDNLFHTSAYTLRGVFAGCAYQGVAIESGDFGLTTLDYDIRIYEKSVVTVEPDLAGASVSPWHPGLDSYGMLYDDTNYLKIPGFLSYPRTDASGNVSLYLLNRSAYWRSGLAVANREWVNWSQGGDAEAGDNRQWNFTASKLGYVTNYTTEWAGTNATIELAEVLLERANQTIRTYATNVTVPANRSSKFVYADTVYFNGTITFDNDHANVNVNVTLADDTNVTFAWLLNTTHNFHADILANLTELGGDVLNYTPDRDGQLYVSVRTYLDDSIIDFNTTEDFLISNITSTTDTIIVPPGYNVDLYPSFSYEPGKALSISFTDMSVFSFGHPITGYAWDFGDGTPLVFTPNPEHRYSAPGVYTVTLEVTNIAGDSQEVSKEITVRPTPFPLLPYFLICLGTASMIFMGLIYNKREKLRKAVVASGILLWGLITVVVLQYTLFTG